MLEDGQEGKEKENEKDVEARQREMFEIGKKCEDRNEMHGARI